MKRACIHQPDFIPYVGFFDRLIDSDIFIIHDDVQFNKRGWHHRDKIKTAAGEEWLTLPLRAAASDTLIRDMKLADDRGRWSAKHVNKLRENYGKTPGFSLFFPEIFNLYAYPDDNLPAFNMNFILFLLDVFEIEVEIVFSSNLQRPGFKNEKLVHLLHAVGATHYLSGTGALDYLKPDLFHDAGIVLEIQEFKHPVYPQQHGEFLPYLSSLDAVFNCGRDAAAVLRQSRGGKRPY